MKVDFLDLKMKNPIMAAAGPWSRDGESIRNLLRVHFRFKSDAKVQLILKLPKLSPFIFQVFFHTTLTTIE